MEDSQSTPEDFSWIAKIRTYFNHLLQQGEKQKEKNKSHQNYLGNRSF